MDSQKRLILVTLVCAAFVIMAADMKAPTDIKIPSNTTIGKYEDTGLVADSYIFDHGGEMVMKSLLPNKTVTPPMEAITARAYIVGNVENGIAYLEHNSTKPLPVASMSKLITSIAAIDTISLSTVLQIGEEARTVPSDSSHLKQGERFTLNDILFPLLLDSSNVAAESISLQGGNRVKFLELMSSYAWEVGMPLSFFADPTGLSSNNIASAGDMFSLAQYLYHSRPDILAITRIPYVSVATTSEHGAHEFVSTHPFVSDSRFIGGKTGRTTEAGETMLTILRIKNQPITFIVLGSQLGAREYDTRLLIKKFENFVK